MFFFTNYVLIIVHGTVRTVSIVINVFYYASAQHSVAGGILFFSCSSVHASVCASRNIVNSILQSI